MDKIKGIYAIVNIVNHKKYIGSSKNIKKRWTSHKTRLNSNIHHSDFMQRAWNKYGKDNFKLTILEVLDVESSANDLFAKEQEWINKLNPEYNVGSVGGGDNLTNHPRREEIIEKITKSSQERMDNMTEEDKEKMRQNSLGDKNPNWRGGISKIKGACVDCGTEIWKDRIRCVLCSKKGTNNPFFGKQHSEETKKKMTDSHKGKPNIAQRKAIIIDGVYYASYNDAALALGVTGAMITYRVKKNTPGYITVPNKS